MFKYIFITQFFLQALAFASPVLTKYCDTTNLYFKKYNWGDSKCHSLQWLHVRNSVKGTPLPWVIFGEEKDLDKKNVTLIQCGIHGDEITPLKFCYDIIHELMDSKEDFSKNLVIISPLVNPDSFFKDRPTRTNANGVDVNRNFPTKDWSQLAIKNWKRVYSSDKRRFPGFKAMSEPEVVFQMNLVKRYKPNKIISVHAPLQLLDYDGPPIKGEVNKNEKELLLQMSEKANGYKVSNYPHFPGSLGNWAGLELQIPTYTLELPNTNASESAAFWERFKSAIHLAILHSMNFLPVEAESASPTEVKPLEPLPPSN